MITNIELYQPYSVELLFDFFKKLGIEINRKHDNIDRNRVFDAFRILLNQDIITLYRFENPQDGILIEFSFTSTENAIIKINEMWFEGAEFPDFYKMVWFGYQDWYIHALKEKGYGDENKPWVEFVKDNINDFEDWIEKNKPQK